MKFALMGLMALSFNALASNAQDCMKIKNNLDRRYCNDKYLESVKNGHSAERSAWDKSGVAEDTRTARALALETDMQAKKDYITTLQSEVALTEKHLSDLKSAKATAVAAAPAPAEAPKKKKKKKGFRIKL